MTSPDGAFWSAVDAETEGREGAYYVWQREELREALGHEDFGFLASLLGFDGPPFFEADRYVLHLPESVEDQARRRRMDRDGAVGTNPTHGGAAAGGRVVGASDRRSTTRS